VAHIFIGTSPHSSPQHPFVGMADEDKVRGMGEANAMAEKGMALFAQTASEEITLDTDAAAAFKASQEAAIKEKEDHAATLTGKANKNERAAIGKEVAAMKADPKYVDACKIAKGVEPPNGNFCTKKQTAPATQEAAAPAEPEEAAATEKKEKKEKPKKAAESAGISKEERAELESLKERIIKKKAELKEQGLSGGACNKDPEVVAMVTRMTELKIKEDPSLAEADSKKDNDKKKKKTLSADAEKEVGALEREIEEYRERLVSEFKYSKKEIQADPDMQEMQAKLKALKK